MTRDDLVAAARTWLGTPYHHMAKVKHGGVDCGQLIIAAFEESGAVVKDPGFYTSDWHMHRDEDRYIAQVETVLRRSDDDERSVDTRVLADPAYNVPQGEVIVFRVGRTFSHGGIVTRWPLFIHSYLPSGIVEEVDIRGTPMSKKTARIYTFEGYEE